MGSNILIIEADAAMRQNLARRLSGKFGKIVHTGRITDLRKILKHGQIDVVLLGLTLLQKEGLAALKRIKNDFPSIEVITINCSGQVSLSIEGMKLGAFDDFMSPFSIDSLVQRIQDASFHKMRNENNMKRPFRQTGLLN